jgi:hypothetical protein
MNNNIGSDLFVRTSGDGRIIEAAWEKVETALVEMQEQLLAADMRFSRSYALWKVGELIDELYETALHEEGKLDREIQIERLRRHVTAEVEKSLTIGKRFARFNMNG